MLFTDYLLKRETSMLVTVFFFFSRHVHGQHIQKRSKERANALTHAQIKKKVEERRERKKECTKQLWGAQEDKHQKPGRNSI
jgi:hypothetical protein